MEDQPLAGAGSRRSTLRNSTRDVVTYFFVSGLLILIIVMLAITPNPQWMQGVPGESAVGVRHPVQARDSYDTHQLASVPLNAGQIQHIVEARRKHRAFFQRGDHEVRTG
eukprot:CAMPEP_0173392018 /NCGR_PEP_ID=MMETSP1356-20130122/18713_1 /TAXON_ID=77927 ORGANISM="Hemiselmis virescens, Strain PCC157" /NCGR_SAMPLE_ID=MMETSP1356 /ASSEMBLY_ACC=CAM_ASM_000847 /LENGTH=109 /DNA_ID=CAMNT_0014349727 /DNA_START=217 /DNA_END=543 /DNA_ORIENTATION=-